MISLFARRISSPLALLIIIICSCKNEKQHEGYNREEAVATYRVADGFKIEMIASEPLISDPVDMEIDEYGRMYVAEMHGYPLDKSGSGKIILLQDEDSDGIMDKRTVFKDGLVLPNSIMRWKKGLLVTDSPALLYLEDTNGDGVAEKTDTIITGFALTNPQHNANNPVYGLDNWIYIAHEGEVSTRNYKEEFGDVGTEIFFPADRNAQRLPRNANGRSIRLMPDQKKLEMLSSRCQFGHNFDEWGRLLECDNSNHVIHEVVADRYLRRNQELEVSEATQSLSDHLNAAEVFPVTTNPDRQLLTDVGVMTSACGITKYLGGAFPREFANAVFTAEPVSNLVHVDILNDTQATFSAKRILSSSEFLASTDAWARPVNFYTGPDGALYVLDYYRKVIESPEWMSEEAIKAGGLYDGHDKGRIFRITATSGSSAEWTKGLHLGDSNVEKLSKELANPNYWWRINAQRLLIDRSDKKAIPLISQIARGSSAAGRLHALWTLQGMGALSSDQIVAALKDEEPGIRENAIRLAELYLGRDKGLIKELLLLQNDSNAKVRFQLMLTLGYVEDNRVAETREKMLLRDFDDKWMQVAALSAAAANSRQLLQAVLARYDASNDSYGLLVKRISSMIGGSAKLTEINALINHTLKDISSKRNADIIAGLASGIRRRDSALALSRSNEENIVRTFFTSHEHELSKSLLSLLASTGLHNSTLAEGAFVKAMQLAKDKKNDAQKRSDCIEFVNIGQPGKFEKELVALINPNEVIPVQLSVLRALSNVPGNGPAKYIVSNWSLLTPEIRTASIPVFLTDSNRVAILLDALENDIIQPSAVSFGTSVQLMQDDNENLRNRARIIFTRHERERVRVNKDYRESLELDGDPVNGKKVFLSSCSICHQVRGKSGVAIGPDLGTVHNWTKEDVLANILNPDMSIASGFDTWSVELKNGEKVQGIIAAETPVAITLRNNGQLDRMINRGEIASIRSANSSAMPTGLEKKINKQEMADLLAFLRRNQDFK